MIEDMVQIETEIGTATGTIVKKAGQTLTEILPDPLIEVKSSFDRSPAREGPNFRSRSPRTDRCYKYRQFGQCVTT